MTDCAPCVVGLITFAEIAETLKMLNGALRPGDDNGERARDKGGAMTSGAIAFAKHAETLLLMLEVPCDRCG